jgi:flagellar motility protein MotE (MotC chaperone)
MRAGGFQQVLMHLQTTRDQPTTFDQTFKEIEEDFNRMYKHIQKFADIVYFLNWHCTEPISLRLMNLIQWIIASSPSDATLLLTELNDYRGIFEETTPQGTKYTFKPIPSPRSRRKKESLQAEESIPAQVNFSIQHRSTNQAEYTEIAERLNLIIANFNNSRTNKDPHKWIEIKQEIKEIKTDIQKTTKISLYHTQRILSKAQQVNDRILRTIAYMKKHNHFGSHNQNHITNYFQTEDQNSTFDTND